MLLLIVQERYSVRSSLSPLNPGSNPGPNLDLEKSSAARTPRVYDVVLINNELELLEIRLNELHSVIDYFVIIESPTTFSGAPKPLYFRDNEDRFSKFRRQILHIVIPTETLGGQVNAWSIERATRNFGFWDFLDIHRPLEGDWIIISDLDELPRRSAIQSMKYQDRSTPNGILFSEGEGSGGDIFRLGCKFYYYSYEYHHTGPLWNGPVIIRYRDTDSPAVLKQTNEAQLEAMQSITKDDYKAAGEQLRTLRNSGAATYVDDACFHCSWCFSNISTVLTKVESYSHVEHNQERYKDPKWIVQQYRKGLDLFERSGDTFEYVENNKDVPEYVAANPDRFGYMLSRRDKLNAGFLDLDPLDPFGEHLADLNKQPNIPAGDLESPPPPQ
ncbi:hypothetical protein BGZ98_000741 [Dissophora globulifera]|nr:hypothetical protein BGZ98_000741 [Dissophora globulifera]